MTEASSARMDALRRLGVPMVACDWCASTMRSPADPFEGPNVIWGETHEEPDEQVFYACSSGCHDKLRAHIAAKKPRRTFRSKSTR